ncbi:NUDIX domain-containing protein [Bacillus manliponensis]|uniref:NUDIX hydrolase n=1 Tax=Bacillus manliponensis TaxID=574376 RepID=UPI003512F577
MYKHTLCFIRRNNELLMLNRNYDPVKGLWNGVGGKIENDETPLQSAIREIKEETNISVTSSQVHFKGIVTWNFDKVFTGGMYVYVIDLQKDYIYETPIKIDEGILDWKEISWLLSEYNYGVGEMITHFLPYVLHDSDVYEHKCVIENNKLVDYKCVTLNSFEDVYEYEAAKSL